MRKRARSLYFLNPANKHINYSIMSAITKEIHGKTTETLTPQQRRVLNHLEKKGKITAGEALNLYGIARLGARVWELRQMGYNIEKRMVERINRYTEKVYIAQYFMR